MGTTRNAKTRKRPKARFLVFWFSRFLVFSFRWPHPSGQVAFFMCLAKGWQKEFWSQSFKDQIISEVFIIQLQLFPKYYHLLPPRKTCLGMQYQNTILVCTGCKTRVLWQKVPKISLSVEVPWSSRWEWFISIICIGSWRLVRGPTTIIKRISSDWHPWYRIPLEVERICHSTITLMTIQYCNTSRHQKSINFAGNAQIVSEKNWSVFFQTKRYNFLGLWI